MGRSVSVFVLSEFVKKFWSCLFLSIVNMVVVKVQTKKATTGPVASSLPVTVRDTEREVVATRLIQTHSMVAATVAAGDVPHPPLLGKLQGCWKRESVPARSDCGSAEGKGSVGMHCKKIHAPGTVGQGRFLQRNPDQDFHQWPCCSRGCSVVQIPDGYALDNSSRICQGGNTGGNCEQA